MDRWPPCPMCVIYRREEPDPHDDLRPLPPGSGPWGLCGGHMEQTFQLLYDLIKERGIPEREEYL